MRKTSVMDNVITNTEKTVNQESGAFKEAYSNYISQAVDLNKEYDKLKNKGTSQFHARKLLKAHQEKIKKAVKEDEKPWLTTTYKEMQDNNQLSQNFTKWVDSLKKWSIKSYKVVMGLRKLLTKQTFVYHVQDRQHHYSIELTEEEFIALLAKNDLNLNYLTEDKLKSVLDTKNSTEKTLADLFKLGVEASQTNLRSITQKSRGEDFAFTQNATDLENDVIYQELLQMGNNGGPIILNNKGSADHTRIYELYSQLLNNRNAQNLRRKIEKRTKKAQEKNISKKGMSVISKNDKDYLALKNFVDAYINTKGLVRDSISFHRTGDAILDAKTLVENKVGNAVVSVSTIASAIKEIAALDKLEANPEELKNRLNKLFSYKGASSLEQEIQGAAEEYAKKNIANSIRILTS